MELTDLLPLYEPEDLGRSIGDFQYYVSSLAEFATLATKPTEPIPARGQLFKHQEFTKRFMAVPGWDAIILNQAAGTGKSGAMSATAESLLDAYRRGTGHIKAAYFLTKNRGLVEEMKRQILAVAAEGKYNIKSTSSNDASQKAAVTAALQNAGYHIMTHGDFYREIAKDFPDDTDPETIRRMKEHYSSTVLFFDEVHNITYKGNSVGDEEEDAKDRVSSKTKDVMYAKFHQLLHVVDRCKIILASATLMLDSEDELTKIMNLILQSTNQIPDDFSFRDATRASVARYFEGRISYVREMDTYVDLVAMGVPDTISTEVVDEETGGIVPRSATQYLYKSVMSAKQTEAYLKFLNSPSIASQPRRGVYSDQRAISTFVFPNGSYGNEGFRQYIDNKDGYVMRDELVRYLRPTEGATKSEIIARIGELSCKFGTICDILVRTIKPETWTTTASVAPLPAIFGPSGYLRLGPPGFTSGPPGFISGPPGFTSGPPGFPSGPPGFTSGPPGFTSGPLGFTYGPPGGYASASRSSVPPGGYALPIISPAGAYPPVAYAPPAASPTARYVLPSTALASLVPLPARPEPQAGLFSDSKEIKDIPSGAHFIYSPYVLSGAVLLGLCLRLLGFEEYDGSKPAFPPQISRTMTIRPPPEGLPRRLRYALFTGYTPLATRSNILALMNSPENSDGSYVAVIIVTPAGRDGINVSSIIATHLFGSEWNGRGNYQATYRTRRAASHRFLRVDNRRIKMRIFQHAAVLPAAMAPAAETALTDFLRGGLSPEEAASSINDSSIDVRMYRTALFKDLMIARVTRMMKVFAVDCHINWERNVRATDQPGSEACDYQDCTYRCISAVPDRLIYHNYDLLYADKPVASVASRIKTLFTMTFSATIASLTGEVAMMAPAESKKPIRLAIVQKAALSLIINKTPIIDRYGYTSFLRDENGVIYLQRNYPIYESHGDDPYAISKYAADLNILSVTRLADIINESRVAAIPGVAEVKLTIDDIAKQTPAYRRFSDSIDSLPAESRITIFEDAMIKWVADVKDQPFDPAVTTVVYDTRVSSIVMLEAIKYKFARLLYTTLTPTGMLRATQETKVRARKTKEKNKRVFSLFQPPTMEDVITYTQDRNGRVVYVHQLWALVPTQSKSGIIQRILGGEVRPLRILEPHLNATAWRTITDPGEMNVYTSIVQIIEVVRRAPFERYPVYLIIDHVDMPDISFEDKREAFRIRAVFRDTHLRLQAEEKARSTGGMVKVDRRRINWGLECKSVSIFELFDYFFRIGVTIDDLQRIPAEPGGPFIIDPTLAATDLNVYALGEANVSRNVLLYRAIDATYSTYAIYDFFTRRGKGIDATKKAIDLSVDEATLAGMLRGVSPIRGSLHGFTVPYDQMVEHYVILMYQQQLPLMYDLSILASPIITNIDRSRAITILYDIYKGQPFGPYVPGRPAFDNSLLLDRRKLLFLYAMNQLSHSQNTFIQVKAPTLCGFFREYMMGRGLYIVYG